MRLTWLRNWRVAGPLVALALGGCAQHAGECRHCSSCCRVTLIPGDGLSAASQPDQPAHANAGPASSDPAKSLMADGSPAKATTRRGLGHAPDYGWLCGEVRRSADGGAWRLRYAGVGEDDPYAGGVILVGASLDGLHDGQLVRVTGRLADASRHDPYPVYLASDVQPLAALPTISVHLESAAAPVADQPSK